MLFLEPHFMFPVIHNRWKTFFFSLYYFIRKIFSRKTETVQRFVIKVSEISGKIHQKELLSESIFSSSCRIDSCNFSKKRFQHGCFSVSFAKFSRTLILQKIGARRSYSCENSCYVK